MKKRKIYYFTGIIIVLFLAIFLKSYISKTDYPNDFNFTYSFGVNGKESIDTYTNTLIYDSVNGLLEIELKLSKKEKHLIYLKMLENAYMRSPQSFPILFKGSIETGEISILKAEYSNANNNVSWSTHNIDLTNLEDPTNGNLDLSAVNEIGTLIEQIITERTKSMDLPDKQIYL